MVKDWLGTARPGVMRPGRCAWQQPAREQSMTRNMKTDTLLVHGGRDPAKQHGLVNPPVYRGSTVLHPNLAAFERAYQQRWTAVTYGRFGTPTTMALEEAIAAFEGGGRTIAVSSGKAAIAVTLIALLGRGDHLLMVDTAYGPVREICDGLLAGRIGVEVEYYDPLIGARIADRIKLNTKLVYMESPGSLTFEVQDVPAIVAAARARGILTAIDNTWATPYFLRPFAHGVDISIIAATKYICGHADAMLGLVTVPEGLFETVKAMANALGNCPGSTEADLGLRGLRTLAARLDRHQASAMTVARWLQARPEVERVLYPALPDDPGHALWRRDFTGASGLLGVVLHPVPRDAVAAMVDGMAHFGLGASFGGYESLVLPARPEKSRSATAWTGPGPLLRLHIGLEDVGDLIADLEDGLARLTAAAAA